MGIRTSGLVSGLDTESIIKELMDAQSQKKVKVENKITKLEWKQEKWKELNTKIYALYTGSLSKLKAQGSYLTKKASSSNESKVSIESAGTDASEGTNVVSVQKLASSQYVTGQKLGTYLVDGEETSVTTATKLSDLGFNTDGTSVINISSGDSDIQLAIDEDTTVYSFISACKEAGLNASFDSTHGRMFISSSKSGADGAFSITSNVSSLSASREELKTAVGYDNMSSTDQSSINTLIQNYRQAVIDSDGSSEAEETLTGIAESITELAVGTVQSRVKAEVKAAYKEELGEDGEIDETELQSRIDAALESDDVTTEIDNLAEAIGTALGNFETAVSEEVLSASTDGGLSNLGLSDITYATETDGSITYTYDSSAVSVLGAADGEITFNGATLTGSSNTYSVNGLSFTANSVTSDGETINLTVTKDVDSAYSMVKTFVSDFNTLLQEMNDLYYADSARSYDVLTDDERDSMTDEQIEKWETKIKDALLRSDTTLGSLMTSMKTAIMGSVEVDGKSYSLSSFGVTTGDYSEQGLLHILGDSEDSYGSDYDDKLKTALANDPDTVIEVMTTLAKNMYSTMTDKMKSSYISSALTFYNDKEMNNTMTDYKEQLSTWEDRLLEMEDRYYDQFTAMETAMANLTSEQNTLSSLLGTSTSS